MDIKLQNFIKTISENGKYRIYSIYRDGLLFFRREDNEVFIYGGAE